MVRSQALNRGYTIGQLAAAAGVNVETVRYYQGRNLLAEPKRPPGRTRRYGELDAERLRFIKGAQRLGFSLSEVKDLLGLLAPMSCSKTQKVAAAKLKFVDERIRELQALRRQFVRLLAACENNADEARCPIIERLTRGKAAKASTPATRFRTNRRSALGDTGSL
jgi:MerR family mercuric resistance operon transcriptional regulator